MKKIIVLAILILLLTILDNSLMPFISFKGYIPSLLYVFAICYSIISGKWQALWIGVVTGLFQDLYFLNSFGINCFTNLIACIIAAKIGESIFKEKKLIPVVSVLGLTVLKQVLILIIFLALGQNVRFESVLYISLYNMIICFLFYKKIYKLCNKDYMQRQWKF